MKIYGEALCKDVPYKTLLLSIRDCAGAVVREMLDKYGLSRADPTQWCLVQVNANACGTTESEYVLDDDECPLSILMNSSNTGKRFSLIAYIIFYVPTGPCFLVTMNARSIRIKQYFWHKRFFMNSKSIEIRRNIRFR